MNDATRTSVGGVKLRLPIRAVHLPVILGLGALAIPTIVSLARQTWATEAGAHGPIVMAVGCWLLARESTAAKEYVKPGSLLLALGALALSLAFYVFGRAFDFITFEVTGLYGACVSSLYAAVGLRSLMRARLKVCAAQF